MNSRLLIPVAVCFGMCAVAQAASGSDGAPSTGRAPKGAGSAIPAAVNRHPVASEQTHGAVYNLKVVTDASPDYSDMESMIQSITANWQTPEEKCWAMFYWNHIARRQTSPMQLHGLALTDPIRQFNDYGYTMCSTISGINCSIWDAMGLKTRYWDISNHTVSEVEYGGRWHMYDNSMTAVYTLCDGHTIAAVSDIGASMACAASGGETEPGHIAKYHCQMATSPRGYLSGADTIRSLDEEYRCFNPNGLKYRSYFYDWDRGHRYTLNVRANESYTRHYYSLGKTPDFYVPNNGKDPEAANPRYRIRGNGIWTFQPTLTAGALPSSAHSYANIKVLPDGGVVPAMHGQPGEIIFKINGANVITAMKIRAQLRRRESGKVAIALSTINGLRWQEIWNSDQIGDQGFERQIISEVSGAYEVLVKVTLAGSEEDAFLRAIEFETTTMINSKTQPQLLLGKNTVHVGAGHQSDSVVLWPDLQGPSYKPYVVDEKNIVTRTRHPGYMGVMHAAKPKEEAYVVFRLDAPRDITRITYGGRLYNRAPGSRIEFQHSFDEGKTWMRSYSLTNTQQPWDVIRYETAEKIPAGTRSVWCKYLLQSPQAGSDACSIYAVRMEANHEPASTSVTPTDVTFRWGERQADYSMVERSHTERVSKLPHRYHVNVGGADHPIVRSLQVAGAGSATNSSPGYSDGKDVGGEKFVPKRVVRGNNLALHKPYTLSVPSGTQWGAGDPDGKRLTDGIAGPPYPGGTAPSVAALWNQGQKPDITVDLGEPKLCGAFRIQLGAGWPWWDALKGQFKDQVEVFTSLDGNEFTRQGNFDLKLRWKDLPVNHFWPDEEAICAHLFELLLPKQVEARYVRFNVRPARALTVSEVEVFDSIHYEPFDLKLAMP